MPICHASAPITCTVPAQIENAKAPRPRCIVVSTPPSPSSTFSSSGAVPNPPCDPHSLFSFLLSFSTPPHTSAPLPPLSPSPRARSVEPAAAFPRPTHRLPLPTDPSPSPSSSNTFAMGLCGGTKSVQRKLVLLGDGACGKTSLLNVFTRGYFPTVYEPTVFENYVHDIYIDNTHVELSLWDTAGQEEFDRLRSLSYDDTHAIMLCFSVDSPDSLENVETKWVGEIAENCPNVKLVLVALKCDLRKRDDDDDGEAQPEKPMIQYDDGLKVAEKIKALRYLECSAMKNRGVNEAFTEAARVALSVKTGKDKSSGCTVM
ncbi:unnamed protein product [Periconia digitata]|uniref:GTP-binding protein RHO3 n=1 Tax=Periconia digitata TaxID=1303443 RepID=A0A9W4XSJ1_9PLEO|nr:unnamed protein product [Periconia digitata]